MRKDGDAELVRMNVMPAYRGRGLSKKIFDTAKKHAKESGFRRIVLTTSTVQEVACLHLYPNLGFHKEREVRVFSIDIYSVFFSMNLSQS